MKLLHASLLLVAAATLLALWAEPAEATTSCHASGDWCQGFAHASTATGGTASQRCFVLTVTAATPTCSSSGVVSPADQAGWKFDAGACATVRYYDVANGALPPAVPNKVSISFKWDNTVTNIYVAQSMGAEPANGATFTVCGTHDGTAGGSPRAGMLRMNVRAIKDTGNGLPGNTNYDINSDCQTNTASCNPSGGPAIVGAMINGDRGALNFRTIVSGITASAPPSGSFYAYGAAADEVVTITASFTPPFLDSNLETMRTAIIDEATLGVGAVGATVDVDSGSLAQNHVSDGTFQPANNPHVAAIELVGNSGLTGTTKWTNIAVAGNGACVVRDTDLVAHCSADLTFEPSIAFDSDGAGTFATADEDAVVKLGSSSGAVVDVLNRAETVYSEFYIFNARDEQLTRTMTIGREDAASTTCASASLAPTAGKYSFTGTISTGTCIAANTEAGSPRYYRATNTDQIHVSGEVHAVSTLLFLDAHLEADATLNPDDYPTEDANEVDEFFVRLTGGVDDSDTIRLWCGVQGVRKDVDIDTGGTAVTTWRLRDPTGATRASTTGDTGANGFTASALSLLATTPLGAWNGDCAATFNSNTGTDTEPFTIGVEGGGGGETVYTGADPLTGFAAYNATSGLVHVSIHSRFLDGTARLGAEDAIFFDVFDVAYGLVADDQAVVELGDGAYAGNWTPPAPGLYYVVPHTTDPVGGVDPVGAHNLVVVQNLITDLENANMDITFGLNDFLLSVAWLAAFWFFSWRMSVSGSRYVLAFFFCLCGTIGQIVGNDELVTVGLVGLVIGIFWVALRNRFGKETAPGK